MFRIRLLTPDAIPANRRLIDEAKAVLRERLPGISQKEFDSFEHRLRDPLASRMHSMLMVADDMRGRMLGFAYVSHVADCRFCLLEYIATPSRGGGGVGGALYERVRDACRGLDVIGLFFECLPDEPQRCSDPAFVKPNAARLRFYERYGARPIINTRYEMPVKPGQMDMPHLVFDDLGSGTPLSREQARIVVRAILERKYGEMCSPQYVQEVVDSITDDPVQLRPPKHTRGNGQALANSTGPNGHSNASPTGTTPTSSTSTSASASSSTETPTAAATSSGADAAAMTATAVPQVQPRLSAEKLIALVVHDQHEIHHVRERGYVEAPARINAILRGIEPTGFFYRVKPVHAPEAVIRAVHDAALVDYLKKACAEAPEGRSVYPYVFPVRNQTRPPKDRAYAAGYYCIDTFTPINRSAYAAAVRSVDCAMTAADALLGGQRLAYALVRPPGHHAETHVFGGFCYFCNAAVAANHLSKHGRVAILDIDYHHGNGQQQIFYRRRDVLTVSIHGHPTFAYPFFTGFEEESGEGDGSGYNINLPLRESIDAKRYTQALLQALGRVRDFKPDVLVVSLGFDTGKGDPTGTWPLRPADFHANARLIAAMDLPTLVVQEGGYRTVTLPANARAFFTGIAGEE